MSAFKLFIASYFYLSLLIYFLPNTPVLAQDLSVPLNIQIKSQQQAKVSQEKIDKLDQETLQLLNQYRYDLSYLDDLNTYNKQLQRQVNNQRQSLTQKQAELDELQTSKQRMVPHLLRMLEVLQQFVALDLPFLPHERNNRIEQLQQLMDRSDVSLAEKYRRLIEAYRVEAEYGHSIESYQGEVDTQQGSKTVDFLRLGRLELYYLSLDGNQAARWDQHSKQWIALQEEFRAPIKRAMSVAKKQLPVELLQLPIQREKVQ